MHEYDSNKPESFNKFLTKFLPKHKFFASTIVNHGRTYLAITVDSDSYAKTHGNLFVLLGIKMTKAAKEHHQHLDRTRELGKKRKLSTRYTSTDLFLALALAMAFFTPCSAILTRVMATPLDNNGIFSPNSGIRLT
jgi:putative Ca2+/H+ antiporter (TMEM165/GDT1 family)